MQISLNKIALDQKQETTDPKSCKSYTPAPFKFKKWLCNNWDLIFMFPLSTKRDSMG